MTKPTPWPMLHDDEAAQLIVELMSDCLTVKLGDAEDEQVDAILADTNPETVKDALVWLVFLESMRGALGAQLVLHEDPLESWREHLLRWQRGEFKPARE